MSLSFHVLGLAYMLYGYQSLDSLVMDAIISKQYGGHLQFLTVHGLLLACATFLLAIFLDIFPALEFIKFLKSILLLLSLPASVAISTVYWSLRLCFPALILPDSSKFQVETNTGTTEVKLEGLQYIPLPVDFALHLIPALVLSVDFFLLGQKFSSNQLRKIAPSILVIYALGYTSWIEWCAVHNQGKFPYPFLPADNTGIRIGIYVFTALFAYASLHVINRIHR